MVVKDMWDNGYGIREGGKRGNKWYICGTIDAIESDKWDDKYIRSRETRLRR